ncbi:MAG: hypothetical protein ABIP28_09025 [Mucilaginibacter sp.]
MKKKLIITLIAAIAIFSDGFAQNCDKFIYMTNGKVIKYSATDAKGKKLTKMTYTVKSKMGNKAIVQSEIIDGKDKPISKAEVEMICDGNNLKLDMRSFIPGAGLSGFKNMTVKADVSYLTYPSKLQTGQKLEDGVFNMQMFRETQKMADMSFKMLNRTVEATENVTTPAGTYDCYKITYNIEMKTTAMGFSIPMNIKITEWYSAKLGLFVKSNSFDKNGKPMGSTLLESIN